MTYCNHYWIIDKDGNARCRYCGEIRQFPPEKIELTHFERTLVEQYDPPAFWQTGMLHEPLEQIGGNQ